MMLLFVTDVQSFLHILFLHEYPWQQATVQAVQHQSQEYPHSAWVAFCTDVLFAVVFVAQHVFVSKNVNVLSVLLHEYHGQHGFVVVPLTEQKCGFVQVPPPAASTILSLSAIA